MLAAQGNGPAALASYQAALAIAERVAKADPSNTGWQLNLWTSHMKIGEMLAAQGPAALVSYQAALASAERLATADPTNTDYQRTLVFSLMKLNEATGDKAHAARALDQVLAMERRGILGPGDAWMLEDLKRRLGQ